MKHQTLRNVHFYLLHVSAGCFRCTCSHFNLALASAPILPVPITPGKTSLRPNCLFNLEEISWDFYPLLAPLQKNNPLACANLT